MTATTSASTDPAADRANSISGAVSGLASAFPEIVSALVHERSDRAGEQVTLLRTRLASIPFHAALKEVLAARGLPIRPDVRPPLRGLTTAERAAAMAVAAEVGALSRVGERAP